MNVYTDGSCDEPGNPNAKAGIGIFFGLNDSRNVSHELKGKNLSHNIAELTAILNVFLILKKELKNNQQINIYSDSEYSINSVTKWYPKWKKENKLEGKKNLDLISSIYSYLKKFKNVKLIHIKAHTGLSDEHSLGNEKADALAGESIGIKKFKYYENFKVQTKDTNTNTNTNTNSNINYVFTFGKYKGRDANWVKDNDEGYIEWCIDNLSNETIVNKLKSLED